MRELCLTAQTRRLGREQCENMGMTNSERNKDEKINGVIYNMSPTPGFKHGIINNNINTIIKHGLKKLLRQRQA